ncbi:MAG: hypothetical protein P8M78_11875 [Myxococcota bacterium]|nr:hypothetical protein [Myxococcota bacterium]
MPELLSAEGGEQLKNDKSARRPRDLRALAVSEGPLTYAWVAPGSGVRAGIDRDLDSVLDGLDNCPGYDNLDQLDDDGDGIANICDPTPVPEPEPEMMAGLCFGGLMLFILVSARRRERAFRV